MASTPNVPPSDRGPSHTDRHPDKSEKKAIEESQKADRVEAGRLQERPR